MAKQNWQCLQLEVPSACCEDLGAHAYVLGSSGLQAEEAGERTRLSIYFAAELDLVAICGEMESFLASLGLDETAIASERVEERDWETEWRRFFQPLWVTPRIVVHPSWIPVPIADDQVAVTIDPKMAFGTGGHESTQLCLQALERYLSPGDHCLDLGVGSGILSIAAALLGAGQVLAVDTDPVAVDNARENVERNHIGAGQVAVRLGSLDAVAEDDFDLVLANIQSHVLKPILAPLQRLLVPGGTALFSGLLVREGEAFCGWLGAAGLRVVDELKKGEWTCIVARRSD